MDADPVSLYDYVLPAELIAQRPAARRDGSRLLVLRGNEPLLHRTFRDLPEFLRAGDLLVRNDTRVMPARLLGKRSGGGAAELLLVRRLPERCGERETWLCLARPASHLKPGRIVSFAEGGLSAEILERCGEGRVVAAFTLSGGETFSQALDRCGRVPLPPYINRRGDGPDAQDAERYQTHYAASGGAVAAPTAGLHFTSEIDRALAEKGVELRHLTLHVGPGTFRPVTVEDASDHVMDEEWYCVPAETAAAVNRARAAGRRVVAVGTTATRALESAATGGEVTAGEGWSRLFIRPGYSFRAVDCLLTNFHLPRSTLLMLAAALAGREKILAAYAEAVRDKYRFYSYGDAMLIVPPGKEQA